MASKTQYPPNDLSRRERTRKAGKCQWCESKVPLKNQYVVYNDLDAGKVVVSKDASRPSAANRGHWCSECKDKRVKLSEAWLARRENGEAKAKAKPKPKKTAAKAKPKAKGKAKAKKPGARKPRAKATSGADPF